MKMTSFWATSNGEKATGEVTESNFDPLPKAWYKSMFESASIDEYEGEKKVKFKARVVGEGFGKNRVLFLNLKCWDEDEKKRDRAIQLLVKIFNILGVKLPKAEPDDADLSELVDKPLDLLLDVWDWEGKSGNWLVNAEAKGVKAGSEPAKVAPKKPGAVPTKREPGDDDMDDDIPF
jgi:hypothetical protein